MLDKYVACYFFNFTRKRKIIFLSFHLCCTSLCIKANFVGFMIDILHVNCLNQVSGDCTYFDCNRLSMILESETLTSVPIGIPIANCDVVLAGEDDLLNHGEIYVAGLCNSVGYYSDSAFKSLDYTKLPQDCTSYNSLNSHGGQLYFKTGDFARRLHGGDLVFLGRKDRTIKLQGHRIALEEIDDILRGHPEVVDTAVISCKEQGEGVRLVAFIVLKDGGSSEIFRSNIKSWMIERVPSAMLPHDFIFTKSLPLSSTGKVDYELLASSSFSAKYTPDCMGNLQSGNLLKVIKKVFFLPFLT